MISPDKLAANQANAQHSTGPKTPEGKARSATNSRTHGLCAQDVIVADEDREEFETMSVLYQVDVSPQGEVEGTLFSELVRSGWSLRRIGRMETEACSGHASYEAILNDEGLQKKLDNLARHKTRIERTFHRSLKELKALQTLRAQQQGLTSEQRMDHPPLATIKQNSKRTQPSPPPPANNPAPEDADLEFAQLLAKANPRAAEIFARVTQNLGKTDSEAA